MEDLGDIAVNIQKCFLWVSPFARWAPMFAYFSSARVTFMVFSVIRIILSITYIVILVSFDRFIRWRHLGRLDALPA